jgi:hypothetical protein
LAASKSSERVTVSKESCTSKLPVLCFAQGRFVMTKKTYARNEASQACYDLSTESVLASEIDERMLIQMGASNWSAIKKYVMPPLNSKGDRYVFRNAVMAGMFVAPQEDSQLKAVITSSDVPASKTFWIALRTNTKGDLVSSVPLIAPNRTPYISHFDGMGNLIFLREEECNSKYPNDCLPFSNNVEGPVVLHHSRTRFGAAIVNPVVSGEFAALCFNPQTNTFLKSTSKSKNFKDAFSMCMQAKAVFVAPSRPLQWVASLLVAKPTFPQLPFPVYGKNETLSDGTLWTGLEFKGGKYTQILPDKPDSCLFDSQLKSVAFDAKTQSPSPASHLERDSNNKLVLKYGDMGEDGKEVWFENEDDLIEVSKQILASSYGNFQYKPCAKPVPGLCGSANGVAVDSAPNANLCAEGTASSVNGTGPWDWKCQGSPGTTAVSCSAPKAEPVAAAAASCNWDGWGDVDFSKPKADGYNFRAIPSANNFPKGAVATCCKNGKVMQVYQVTNYAGGVDPWSCNSQTGFPGTCPSGTSYDQNAMGYNTVKGIGWSIDYVGAKCGKSNLYKYSACLPPCTP